MKTLLPIFAVLGCCGFAAATEPSATTLSTKYVSIQPTSPSISRTEPTIANHTSNTRLSNATSIPSTNSSTPSTLLTATPALDISLQLTSTSLPEEASITSIPNRRDNGFSTLAIVGVLAGTAALLIFTLIICLILRQQKRKRYKKMLEAATSSKNSSPSLKNESLKGIVVTRKVESKIVPIEPEDVSEQSVRFSVQRKPS